MIKFLDENEIEQITFLWNKVFGDDEEFIKSFVKKIGVQNVLGYFVNEKLVSMFCLINSKLEIGQESFKSFYLYAACTLPEYRGKGYMKELILYAQDYIKNGTADYIALVPAEKSLFAYYEKFGFYNFFYRKVFDKETENKNISYSPYLNLCDVEKYSFDLTDDEYISHSYPPDTHGDIECNGMIYSANSTAKDRIKGKKGFFRNVMA